jgi:6,7-dimethyl-8-ribityllumazine synthase|tara:strand:- start:817 stop:1224 length:408 start_codon:yes stop_codon:yes gene_type:complete
MKKVLIVCANYYPDITFNLKTKAVQVLNKAKINNKFIYAPGIFEIPVIISKNIKKFDAFIALGCVIKGETPHFEFISKATFEGIMKISIDNKKPIGNGIITALNKNQAIKRSSNLSKKNKGFEAAQAVISVLKNV